MNIQDPRRQKGKLCYDLSYNCPSSTPSDLPTFRLQPSSIPDTMEFSVNLGFIVGLILTIVSHVFIIRAIPLTQNPTVFQLVPTPTPSNAPICPPQPATSTPVTKADPESTGLQIGSLAAAILFPILAAALMVYTIRSNQKPTTVKSWHEETFGDLHEISSKTVPSLNRIANKTQRYLDQNTRPGQPPQPLSHMRKQYPVL